MQALIVALALGFPIAVGLPWAFELTPEGVKRTEEVSPQRDFARHTGRRLDFAIIGILTLALALVVIDEYVIEAQPFPEVSSLAVLSHGPFVNPEQLVLAPSHCFGLQAAAQEWQNDIVRGQRRLHYGKTTT